MTIRLPMLPAEAHCFILLVNHDLYEIDNDVFCRGRAYGESRICVVSSAQYQPALDAWHGVDIKAGHFWLECHCGSLVGAGCGVEPSEKPRAAATKGGIAINEKPRRRGSA